jgi:hypothetical protein
LPRASGRHCDGEGGSETIENVGACSEKRHFEPSGTIETCTWVRIFTYELAFAIFSSRSSLFDAVVCIARPANVMMGSDRWCQRRTSQARASTWSGVGAEVAKLTPCPPYQGSRHIEKGPSIFSLKISKNSGVPR